MARDQGKNFFQAHWDWLAAAGGLAVAGAAYALCYLGDQPPVSNLTQGHGEAVEAVDLAAMNKIRAGFEKPGQLGEVSPTGNFLMSHARFFCTPGDETKTGCGAALEPDVETCPYCKLSQKAEREKIVIDKDEDGLTDEYELANGLDPNRDDAEEDLDGDGFTNFEEFEAQTKPNDPLSHPDYLAKGRVKVSSESTPKTTRLQFRQRGYEVPNKGHKFEFFHPDFKREMCRGVFSAFKGEEIMSTTDGKKPVTTGFILESYEEKKGQKTLAGGMKQTIDQSEVTVKRKSDGKKIVLKVGQKETLTDISATLTIEGLKEGNVFTKGDGEKIEIPAVGVSYLVKKVEQISERGKKIIKVQLVDEATQTTTYLLSE